MERSIGFKKVLLVNLLYEGSHYKHPSLLSGLGYVSESLSTAGIENKVLDLALGYGMEELHSQIALYKPELLGFFMMTYRFLTNYGLLGNIKEKFPSIPIVLGGPHISTLREDVLKECSGVDYGVVLEGEETAVELCRGDDPEGIKGLISRKNGSLVFSGERAFIEDLDRIPFPTFSRFEIERYPYPGANRSIVPMPIVTSRGCPYSCIYCPVGLAIGRRYRFRSPGNIMRELEHWYSKGYRSFWIADDVFTLKKERVHELCSLLEKSGMKGMRLGCGNGVRADTVDRDLLSHMKSAGFWSIAFGIESGSDKVLKSLLKSEKTEDAEKSIRNACELGYEVTLFFLLGSPGETEDDFRKSLELARKFPVSDVRFYNMIPFPKTRLHEWLKEKDYFITDSMNYLNTTISWENNPVYETPEMPLKTRKMLFVEGERVRRGIKASRLERKLQSLGLSTLAGHPLARILTIPSIEFLWRENKFFNKAALGVSNFLKERHSKKKKS